MWFLWNYVSTIFFKICWRQGDLAGIYLFIYRLIFASTKRNTPWPSLSCIPPVLSFPQLSDTNSMNSVSCLGLAYHSITRATYKIIGWPFGSVLGNIRQFLKWTFWMNSDPTSWKSTPGFGGHRAHPEGGLSAQSRCQGPQQGVVRSWTACSLPGGLREGSPIPAAGWPRWQLFSPVRGLGECIKWIFQKWSLEACNVCPTQELLALILFGGEGSVVFPEPVFSSSQTQAHQQPFSKGSPS